jgi:hypothetical protein
MKKLILALTFTEAATMAHASGPITLDYSLLTCRSLYDWEQFVSISKARDLEGGKRFLAQKDCTLLPVGVSIYADRKIGHYECLRAKGEPECRWSAAVVFTKTGQEP